VADTITVKFKVMEDGSLKAIGKDADKASAALNQAGNTADNFKKKQKGVAGATSNGTKAFSKMTTGIQGGLVPAYAEIAARVFALTAAFGVLSRNNAIAKLQEGIEFTGRAAGRNLTFVADKLQEITDNAISAEAAMRATAVGVSAGFSESQMAGLAEVAKGASLALGRDMADAMDRLIRGAAKLEPEILDELGIMVRLDEATENYARTLNKNVNELTQFERRMAFTNAIIEQGRQKFDGISASIEASPFSKLAASLQDVAKTGIGALNKVLGPMANFLAENTFALGALVALYAGSVAGTIMGGITSMAAASASAAVRTEAQSKAALKAIKPHALLNKRFNDLAASGKRGGVALKNMHTALNNTIKAHNVGTAKLKAAVKMRNQLTAEIYRQNLAQVKTNMTNALGILQEQGLMAGIRAHTAALRELGLATRTTMASQSGLYAIMTAGKGVMLALGSSARFLGASLLAIMPYVGIVLAAVSILGPLVGKLFGMEDTRLEKQIKKNTERFEEFDKVLEQYTQTINKSATQTQLWAKTLKPIAGLLTETAQAMHETIAAAQTEQLLKHVAATKKLAQAQTTLAAATGDGMAGIYYRGKTHDTNEMKDDVKDAEKLVQETSGKMSAAVEEMVTKDLIRGMSKFLSTSDAMATRLEQLGKEGKPVADALNAVKASQAGVNDVLQKMLAGKMTPQEAATQMTALATSATASVQAFENFNDIVNKAKDLVGDITSTWGLYGKEIDNVAEAVINVEKILNDGKGSAASKEKANAILKAYGIDEGGDAVGKLKALEAQLKKINDANKRYGQEQRVLDYDMAAGAISQLELNKTALDLTDRRLQTVEDEIRLAIPGSQKMNELQEKRNQLLIQEVDLIKKKYDLLSGDAESSGMGKAASAAIAGQASITNASTKEEADGARAQVAKDTLSGVASDLAAMGPEGALMSSAIQGALDMESAFSTAFAVINDDSADMSTKVQAGLGAIGATISALGAMSKAASDQKIAGIDNEIAAEKARDGKSAGSVAKLAALEKKKEQAKRKAFEMDKKMKMAQTVISTAQGVTAMLGAAPPPFNFALAGMVAAMGAQQLSMISGMTFQGGASSAPAAPSQIAVGSRNASVDLAKGQNAGGELAYARGEQGIGSGMTDFKPTSAFAGYKHRAGGGYVVGEQGPELFMPDTPGQIIPSGQGTGGQTNVNFSINAVDSAGVEDLLMNQRGNIIGMIREAANEHGEFFLESVQDKSY